MNHYWLKREKCLCFWACQKKEATIAFPFLRRSRFGKVCSKYALQILRSIVSRTEHTQLILQMYHLLTASLQIGQNITFQWVPGHCGVLRNPLADGAAKSAHGTCKTIPIPFTTSDVNILTRRLNKDVAASLWSTPACHHRRLYWLDPELTYRPPSGPRRTQESLPHGLRLGVAYTSAIRLRIGHVPRPNCISCACLEVTSPILTECLQYMDGRR